MKGEKMSLNKIFRWSCWPRQRSCFVEQPECQADPIQRERSLVSHGRVSQSSNQNSATHAILLVIGKWWLLPYFSCLVYSTVFLSQGWFAAAWQPCSWREPPTPRGLTRLHSFYDFSIFSAGLSWNPEQLLCRRNQVARCCLVSPLSI